MDYKGLLKDRTVQVLLLVVVLNVVCFVLVWRFNVFVHGDLYDYGLIFSLEWAQDFWYSNMMLWVFLIGATALSALSIIPHRQHSVKPGTTSKWLGFLLPSIAIVYQALSIMYFWQMYYIVQNRLIDYGLVNSFEWASTYNSLSATTFALMAIVLIALIIPAIRTLDIIKVEIEIED